MLLPFAVPKSDTAKPGRPLITIEWCYHSDKHILDILGYIQVTPVTVGDLPLAHKIGALPKLIAICKEVAHGNDTISTELKNKAVAALHRAKISTSD